VLIIREKASVAEKKIFWITYSITCWKWYPRYWQRSYV